MMKVGMNKVRENRWNLLIAGVLSIMLISLLLFHGCAKKEEMSNLPTTNKETINTTTAQNNMDNTPLEDLTKDIQEAESENVNLSELDNAGIDTNLFE